MSEIMIDDRVYVRKLYAQELGIRSGREGEAGRYFFVSHEFTQYFPPLSKTVLNDSVYINIMPSGKNETVLSKYIYHNSRFAENRENGRNEYRIYLNSDIEPGGDTYKIDDIIVFQRISLEGDLIYKLYHFPVRNREAEYDHLNSLLERYAPSRSGNHALVPIAEIPFIELLPGDSLIKTKIIPEKIKEDALASPFEMLPVDLLKEEFQFTNLIRENAFRELVLYFYGYKCAFTDKVLNYKELYNLEAAHIIPDSHLGPAHPKNGLALSRDMHWAFDKGFLTVNTEFIIQVHEAVRGVEALACVHGRRIFLPQDTRAYPSEKALDYHSRTVFGLFLTSGRL